MDPSILINWISPFPILGVSGELFFILILFQIDIPVSKQWGPWSDAAETLIRCGILWRLIWVCTGCLCRKNGTLGLYGLTSQSTIFQSFWDDASEFMGLVPSLKMTDEIKSCQKLLAALQQRNQAANLFCGSRWVWVSIILGFIDKFFVTRWHWPYSYIWGVPFGNTDLPCIRPTMHKKISLQIPCIKKQNGIWGGGGCAVNSVCFCTFKSIGLILSESSDCLPYFMCYNIMCFI